MVSPQKSIKHCEATFNEHYEALIRNDRRLLNKEYEAIQNYEDNLKLSSLVAKANGNLNRYSNILPYDFNRVKLDGDEFEDEYINASFINVRTRRLKLQKKYTITFTFRDSTTKKNTSLRKDLNRTVLLTSGEWSCKKTSQQSL